MDAFLSDTQAAFARDQFYRLFLTAKKMGTTIDLTFTRRHTETNAKIDDSYTGVLLTLADRQAQNQDFDSAFAVATQGKLSREIPFAPQPGDLTVIRGRAARVQVVYPEMNRIVRADIVFTNPYGSR